MSHHLTDFKCYYFTVQFTVCFIHSVYQMHFLKKQSGSPHYNAHKLLILQQETLQKCPKHRNCTESGKDTQEILMKILN